MSSPRGTLGKRWTSMRTKGLSGGSGGPMGGILGSLLEGKPPWAPPEGLTGFVI